MTVHLRMSYQSIFLKYLYILYRFRLIYRLIQGKVDHCVIMSHPSYNVTSWSHDFIYVAPLYWWELICPLDWIRRASYPENRMFDTVESSQHWYVLLEYSNVFVDIVHREYRRQGHDGLWSPFSLTSTRHLSYSFMVYWMALLAV
jgi:hypothetical protein